MESIVIKRVGGRERAYPAPYTHIRVHYHLGLADVRYVTSDGYLGVHLDTDPVERTEEVRADLVRVITIGGRQLLGRLFAAVAPGPTSYQAIPVIVVEVAA
jgi:hypothetical protein